MLYSTWSIYSRGDKHAGRMQPVKEFATIGKTSILELSFPSNLYDATSKARPLIEPLAYHTEIIQTYSTILSSVSGFSSSSIVNNISIIITHGPLQLQQYTSKYLSESLACLAVVGIT